MSWICVSKKDNEYRALYYSYDIGKHRIYRSGYPFPSVKTFRLYVYKRKENAQLICDAINEAYFDNFEPLEVDESVVEDVKNYAKQANTYVGIDIAKGNDVSVNMYTNSIQGGKER